MPKLSFFLGVVVLCWQYGLAQPYTFTSQKMGGLFSITIDCKDSLRALSASDKAFARIDAINLALSDYAEKSETWKLNAGNFAEATISDDLAEVLRVSRQVYVATNGAFDPAIGNIVQLWRRARRKRELPEPEAIKEAVAKSGMDGLWLDTLSMPHKLGYLRSGIRLDFGGIGKGYAVDEALKLLINEGVPRAYVSAESSIAVGRKPRKRGQWTFVIETRGANGEEMEEAIKCSNCFIASSGDIFQYMELGGVKYSHIVSPATGEALTNGAFVIVMAPTATLADAYATALCVMDLEDIRKVPKAIPALSALVWKKEGDGLKKLCLGKYFGSALKNKSPAP